MTQVITAVPTVVASDDTVAVADSASVVLKGTGRGLEITINSGSTATAIAASLSSLLAEAPGFFAGNQARVVTDGNPLPVGTLARLEDVAARFDLRIVEIGARRSRDTHLRLAEGSGGVEPEMPAMPPIPPLPKLRGPSMTDMLAMLEMPAVAVQPTIVIEAEPPPLPLPPPGPRFVVGPVRSGVILEHTGHIVVIGDVNPGAEVRAEGNIVVLGRLRGVAHAAIGRDAGFIVSLSLQPQQLRVCRKVARAGDSDRPGDGAEIAYATGDTIVVERFTGRLPSGLAASI
jgi:septum formation inhibitor MinC